MQRWQGLEDIPRGWPRSVLTIGVFDGVHRGHRAIIDAVVARARLLGVPAVVLTFDPHPSEVIRPGTHPTLLSTIDHRVSLLGSLGVDAVCVLPFTHELSQLSPEEFVTTVMVGRLHALEVIIGENFRFGHRASGDMQTLAELGARHGFEVTTAALIAGTGGVWSSTYVRGLVAAGDVRSAGLSLGRPHRLEGVVVHGKKRGRELGYPTANVAPTPHAAVPADGVYAAQLVLSPYTHREHVLPAALSIGTNPTFDGDERQVEVYALDRDDLDLYGEHVGVDVVERIRGTWKFDDVDSLVARIGVDVAAVRDVLG